MVDLDQIAPHQMVRTMVELGEKKAKLSRHQLVMRGFLSAAILGFATTLALTFEIQTQVGMYGALLFPVGFVMVTLLGLELVTGNFALIPLAVIEKRVTVKQMLHNWLWVMVGHALGGFVYALLMYVSLTYGGVTYDHPLVAKIIALTEGKTTAYADKGMNGMLTVFVKALLCNWMVTIGTVMALASSSTIGKIVAMWLPILTFFGQGFEQAVVNLFIIPAGMLLGADITMSDWWLWNQIPVTIGNVVSGFFFTGLALYVMHHEPSTKKEKDVKQSEKIS